MSMIQIESQHGMIPAYVAQPRSEPGEGGAAALLPPVPGVVVIHDVFGMTADLRRQADWLAAAGFLAVAPDLLAWGRKVACVRSAFRELKARSGRSFDTIEAARVWCRDQPGCTGQVGIIGFCMGGGFALLCAPGRGFAAASVNYGEVPDDAVDLLGGSCPIVGSYGALDRSLRGAAARLDDALTKDGIPHDVKEYPDAGHGFLNRHDGVLASTMGRLTSFGYREGPANDARRRIVEFFSEHLR